MPSRAGDHGLADGARSVDDQLTGQLGHGVVRAVGLIRLEHQELDVVGVVDALVAERLADLVDLVDAADDGALEVELDRDAQQHVLVERVDVGPERARRGTAVGVLQHRGVDLDELAGVEGCPQRLQDLGLHAYVLARLGPHDQVDVPHPAARLVRQRIVLVGQRADGLGGQLPARGLHGQLAAAAGDDLAGHRQVVADVDQRLERREPLLADAGQRDHGLQLGAVALAEHDEAPACRCRVRRSPGR